MVLGNVFQQFVGKSPVTVMFRGAMENIFAPARLDALFSETAEHQYEGQLLFSTVADLLASVVCRYHKSVLAAYHAEDEVGVSVKAVYDKLGGVEPRVSEQLVRQTASNLAEVFVAMKARPQALLPGYRLRILDGNRFAGTDHRIAELRGTRAAALPGLALVVLDPQVMLAVEVIACEDGHANERPLSMRLLETIQAGDCWMADRNFCTPSFLDGIDSRKACFIIRQHMGNARGELVGRRRKLGTIETGTVYEQALALKRPDGTAWTVRRITVHLNRPTRDKERLIHILTNLPAKVSGRRIAEMYRGRWKIETVFQDLATVLRGEVNTLGYPKAALLAFCLALVTFNLLSIVKTAMRTAHRKTAPEKISTYYLANEITATLRGMEIAVPARQWTNAFAEMASQELAKTLLWLAKHVNLARFATHTWQEKREQPPRKSGNRGNHVSTFRVLQTRNPDRK
jgi:hypothetical protein